MIKEWINEYQMWFCLKKNYCYTAIGPNTVFYYYFYLIKHNQDNVLNIYSYKYEFVFLLDTNKTDIH